MRGLYYEVLNNLSSLGGYCTRHYTGTDMQLIQKSVSHGKDPKSLYDCGATKSKNLVMAVESKNGFLIT